MSGPKTVEELMALPVYNPWDDPTPRKTSCMNFNDPDLIAVGIAAGDDCSWSPILLDGVWHRQEVFL